MVPVTCIDDSFRPNEIPLSKWIKKDEQYHVTFTVTVLPQNVLGFSLYEKPLDSDCFPYQYFVSTRFRIKPEDLAAFIELVKGCIETDSIDLNQLLENSNLINQ